MTETFRPSELFALRWRGFDMDGRMLTVSQTAYKGKLRDFGKPRSRCGRRPPPEGLATELWLWGQECPDRSAEAFIFPNARKRNGVKDERLHPHGQLSRPGAEETGREAGVGEAELLNFQMLRRTMATLAQTKVGIKDVQGLLGHSKADTTVNVYRVRDQSGLIAARSVCIRA